jgi:hypothetical protein
VTTPDAAGDRTGALTLRCRECEQWFEFWERRELLRDRRDFFRDAEIRQCAYWRFRLSTANNTTTHEFSAGEQQFFAGRGWAHPIRCKPCRELVRERRREA